MIKRGHRNVIVWLANISMGNSKHDVSECRSNYKHHSTVKYLVGITPNGAISYASGCYGGGASDKFIVEESGFLKKLRLGDQIMADRGFKIHDTLAMLHNGSPSKHKNLQMTSSDKNC